MFNLIKKHQKQISYHPDPTNITLQTNNNKFVLGIGTQQILLNCANYYVISFE